MHTAPFIDDIIVTPQKLPEFLPKLNAILAPYKNIVYTIAGHAGNGNFHIKGILQFLNFLPYFINSFHIDAFHL